MRMCYLLGCKVFEVRRQLQRTNQRVRNVLKKTNGPSENRLHGDIGCTKVYTSGTLTRSQKTDIEAISSCPRKMSDVSHLTRTLMRRSTVADHIRARGENPADPDGH